MGQALKRDDYDDAIAVLCAQALQGALDRLKDWPEGGRRTLLLRSWAFVRGTKAANLGEAAFDDPNAYWCWYTALALELCALVRLRAGEAGVSLP